MTPFVVKESQQWTDSNEIHSYTINQYLFACVRTPMKHPPSVLISGPKGYICVINITILLTHYYHAKPINTDIKFHSWYCTLSDFGQCIIICILHWTTMQNSFTALKILCALLIYPSLPQSLETTDFPFFTDSIVLPLPGCHRAGTPQCAILSYWLLSLSLLFCGSVVSNSLLSRGLQHTRPPCPSPTPRACSNSCPLSQWCHPNISSSVIPFSSCLQSFPASGSFHLVICI